MEVSAGEMERGSADWGNSDPFRRIYTYMDVGGQGDGLRVVIGVPS